MKKAFTLVELITVIIIIAILAALALPQYAKVVERGQSSKAKGCLDAIRKAEGIYFTIYSDYATDLTNTALTSEVPEVNSANLNDADWSYGIESASTSTFTATALRLRGPYADATLWKLQVAQDGRITAVNGYPY